MTMSGDELNLILPKFARPPFFSHHVFWQFHKELLVKENTQYFSILVCNFFTARLENVDCGQY